MPRKKSKKTLRNECDKMWSEIVKRNANFQCEYCGKKNGLNSHHVWSRSNKSVRWDITNGVSLCVAHHVFGNFSAHKAPLEFAEWLKDKRGIEWYLTLRQKSQSIWKGNIEDIYNQLKEVYEIV